MLSLGMLFLRALSIAYLRARFDDGSPPPCCAATMIARLSFPKSLPFRLSAAPFLIAMFAQCECPAIALCSLYCEFFDRSGPLQQEGKRPHVRVEPVPLLE